MAANDNPNPSNPETLVRHVSKLEEHFVMLPLTQVEKACIACGVKNTQLQRCSQCDCVTYCNASCQRAHWQQHKRLCKEVKQSRALVLRLAGELEEMPREGALLGFPRTAEQSYFDVNVGHFWGILEPRDYCRARFKLGGLLRSFGCEGRTQNHQRATQWALQHYLDLLWLCRGDNLGVRDEVPLLLMHLGQVQAAYDFLKWWAVCDLDGTYDWGNTKLPYLNLRDEDAVQEDPLLALQLNKYSSTSSVLNLALVKLAVLAIRIDNERFFSLIMSAYPSSSSSSSASSSASSSLSPPEGQLLHPLGLLHGNKDILLHIRSFLCPPFFATSSLGLVSSNGRKTPTLYQKLFAQVGTPGCSSAMLRKHVDGLLTLVHRVLNKHVLPALLQPSEFLERHGPYPDHYSSGSIEEAYVILDKGDEGVQVTQAWQAVEGAVNYVQAFLAGERAVAGGSRGSG